MEQEYADKLKEWIDYDNTITELKTKVAELALNKKKIEDDVLKYVEDNNLSGVSVSISDGMLKFPTRKVQQSITMKYIRLMLQRYNEDEENANDKVNVDKLCKFLTSNLDTKHKIYIKRDYKEG